MTLATVVPPFAQFNGLDGLPLESGYLYIGTENLDPITNPITVYWDSALSITAAQPVRLINGYPSNNGAAGAIFTASKYSVKTKDSNGSTIFSSASEYGLSPDTTLRADLAASSGSSLVGFLQAGSGAVARTVQSKLRDLAANVCDFGAIDLTGATSAVAVIRLAIAAKEEINFPAGTYMLDDEILVDKSIKFTCAAADEYGSGGTIFKLTHNNTAKAGFKVGYTLKTIRFEMTGEPKFDATVASASYAGLRCAAATVFIDGIRGTANVNGAYFEDCYIGYVNRMQGPGKDYLCKVTGDSSLAFGDVNLGGTTGGLSSFQIVTSGGFTKVDRIYLEAQSTRNLSIDTTSRSAVHISEIYGENSSYWDILINASENVTIDTYRTNSNTKCISITGSTNVRINNIHAIDRLSENEVVNIDTASDNIYIGGVLYDPVSSDGTGVRPYVIMRGFLSGAPASPMAINPELSLSGGGVVSTVGGSAVVATIPADTRMRMSASSITVTNAAPLKIPLVRWRAGASVVVQCIYKCTTSGSSDVAIAVYKASTSLILSVDSFHRADADYQMVTFVTRLPTNITALDQYSSLEFRCAAGKTADVHFLNISEYDGGMIPFGSIDESVLFTSSPVTLNTLNSHAVLIPKVGNKTYRMKNYELIYNSNTAGAGAAATVAFGETNSSGVLSAASCNFTTAINCGYGLPVPLLADTGPRPFRDHIATSANGWGVEVTAAGTHGGTASGYIRAVPVKYNAI